MQERSEFGRYLNQIGLTGPGVEVGVRDGTFSFEVLKHWEGGPLYLIDVWRHMPEYVEWWGDTSDEGHRRSLLQTIDRVAPYWSRVRIIQEASFKASANFRDESLDFVYIDANHSYEYALNDIKAWSPKVRSGGIIAGHDYLDKQITHNGITIDFGVKRAVDELFGPLVRTTSGERESPSWWILKMPTLL